MPGVKVTTATRSGPSAALLAPSGQFFVVGLFERGSSTNVVRVRSSAELESVLGGRTAYSSAWDHLKVFFDEGGLQAQVIRLVGDGATVGTVTLNDQAATPVPTLRVDAASAGAWSSNIAVEILAGASPDTFRVKVYTDGTLIEDYTNLYSPTDVVSRFAQSPYVRFTNLGSATAAPNNIPAVSAPTALSAGTDLRGSLTAADYIDALDLFIADLGDGAVAIPGQNTGDVWAAIIDHCVVNHRIALLAGSRGDTKTDLIAKANSVDSEYAGLFAPWINISDGSTGIRTISPEGYVAAARARAHALSGPWQAAAGKVADSTTILSLDQAFGITEAEDLDSAGISLIRTIKNTVRLYGWRSLSKDFDNYKLLTNRDLLNRLVVEAETILEDYVFQPIDPQGKLLSSVNAELVGMLDPVAAAGGLSARINDSGEEIDAGYLVETGDSVNTPATLAQNEIRARISLRVSPTSSVVSLTIVKVGLLGALSA